MNWRFDEDAPPPAFGPAGAALAWLPDLEAAQAARYPETVLAPSLLTNLVGHGIDSGLVGCSVLRIDGEAASWRIDYRLGDTLYLGFCAIDLRHGQHSPGTLHTHAVLAWHAARGLGAYDLLIGSQGYKYDWTDGAEHALRRLQIDSGAAATVARRHSGRALRQVRRVLGRLGGRG